MRFPTPSEWLKLVDEFRTGKMTLKEFVLEHDVSFNTAQYWIYRKSKQLRSESVSETKFLPVTVVASPALKARGQQLDNGLIEVVRHGLVLRFAVGTDTRYVAELLAALG